MGHGQYLVYISKSSIFEECIIVFQVLGIQQMLSILEECIIVFQAPAQFQKKMSRILRSITVNFGCSSSVSNIMIQFFIQFTHASDIYQAKSHQALPLGFRFHHFDRFFAPRHVLKHFVEAATLRTQHSHLEGGPKNVTCFLNGQFLEFLGFMMIQETKKQTQQTLDIIPRRKSWILICLFGAISFIHFKNNLLAFFGVAHTDTTPSSRTLYRPLQVHRVLG